MSMNEVYKKYEIEAPDGRIVKFGYCPKWSFLPDLEHRVDHFEFDSFVVSETGYWSQFIIVEPNFKETDELIIEQAKRLIEEATKTKYGEVIQGALL
jgi:hypothetical protein